MLSVVLVGVVACLAGGVLSAGAGLVWLARRWRVEAARHAVLDQLPFTSSPVGFRAEHAGAVFRYDRDRGGRVGEWLGVEVPPQGLGLRPAPPGRSVVGSGDPAFDERFLVDGDGAARSWLTQDVRFALLGLPDDSELVEGVVWIRGAGLDPEHLPRLAHVALRFREQSPDPVERWRHQLEDPVPGVRVAGMRALAGADRTVARALASRRLADRDPEVRCWAGLLAQDPGALAAVAEDPAAAVHTRLEAIGGVGRWASRPERVRLGTALVRDREPSVRGAAPALFVPEDVAALEALLRGLDVDALLAAAPLVAAHGSVRAIPALRARRAQATVLQRGLVDELDAAIRLLQERSGGAPGGLALAEGEGGALAVVDGAGGLAEVPPPGPTAAGVASVLGVREP